MSEDNGLALGIMILATALCVIAILAFVSLVSAGHPVMGIILLLVVFSAHIKIGNTEGKE